jgi:hypothetical protein
MVETAIVLPLLVVLLLGVGYFGNIITMQHNLTVAARYAARAVSVESTRNPADRVSGNFFNTVNAEKFKNYALRALPGIDPNRLGVVPIPVDRVLPFKDFGSSSTLTAVNDYTYIYLLAGKVDRYSENIRTGGERFSSELINMDVGMGAVFYGARLTYRLTALDWIARFLFRKKEGVTIDAVSMMPAELPLRSLNIKKVNAGLMDINSGLFKIVRTDPNDKKDENVKRNYVDLVPENE